ncbi:MAG TPA: type II secretion system protein [Gemmatimonadales bacterium]|nr:type II secretion system protein [Gemmatimonadales bacterium]
MTGRRGGFTIVEVLMAIILLGIGMLVLAGGAGGVTRMMSQGSRKTRAYSAASSIVDSLRSIAASDCASLPASGSSTYPGGISRAWTVSATGSTATTHTIVVTTSYRAGTRLLGDTLYAFVYC